MVTVSGELRRAVPGRVMMFITTMLNFWRKNDAHRINRTPTRSDGDGSLETCDLWQTRTRTFHALHTPVYPLVAVARTDARIRAHKASPTVLSTDLPITCACENVYRGATYF
ncbi:hypothetical protein NDU88_000800 [Pleurodeles waltl]|uniref:Uncharacterized protein n=1 Tax=Pleurodeles waltl TaxID=8319 RepID=A0AAV7MKR5_PLEWA|nr:hypothetical protein NDU88_000800 [Pleurodeles waltl]